MNRCRVVIELEMEGAQDDAVSVLERLLDAGVVQDAVTQAAADLDVHVRVTSAVAVLVRERGGR